MDRSLLFDARSYRYLQTSQSKIAHMYRIIVQREFTGPLISSRIKAALDEAGVPIKHHFPHPGSFEYHFIDDYGPQAQAVFEQLKNERRISEYEVSIRRPQGE